MNPEHEDLSVVLQHVCLEDTCYFFFITETRRIKVDGCNRGSTLIKVGRRWVKLVDEKPRIQTHQLRRVLAGSEKTEPRRSAARRSAAPLHSQGKGRERYFSLTDSPQSCRLPCRNDFGAAVASTMKRRDYSRGNWFEENLYDFWRDNASGK